MNIEKPPVLGVAYMLEAQRDDTYQKMLDAFEPLIQQAKAEVAREIVELAGKEVKFSLRRQLRYLKEEHEREG